MFIFIGGGNVCRSIWRIPEDSGENLEKTWRKPGENLEKPGDTGEDMELDKK